MFEREFYLPPYEEFGITIAGGTGPGVFRQQGFDSARRTKNYKISEIFTLQLDRAQKEARTRY